MAKIPWTKPEAWAHVSSGKRIGGNKWADYRTEQVMYGLAKAGKFAGITKGREAVADEMWGPGGEDAPVPDMGMSPESVKPGGYYVGRTDVSDVDVVEPDVYIPTGLWRHAGNPKSMLARYRKREGISNPALGEDW